MHTTRLVLLLAALSTAQAAAAGFITVRSDPRANVYLDNKLMGATPTTIRRVPPGYHQLRMIDPSSGKAQLYSFHVSTHVDLAKEVDATFRPEDPAVLVIHSGYNVATHEVGYRYEDQNYRYRTAPVDRDAHIHTSRDKVRIRNTALGVGTAGLLLGSGPLAVLGLGGAVVNEVTNH